MHRPRSRNFRIPYMPALAAGIYNRSPCADIIATVFADLKVGVRYNEQDKTPYKPIYSLLLFGVFLLRLPPPIYN